MGYTKLVVIDCRGEHHVVCGPEKVLRAAMADWKKRVDEPNDLKARGNELWEVEGYVHPADCEHADAAICMRVDSIAGMLLGAGSK